MKKILLSAILSTLTLAAGATDHVLNLRNGDFSYKEDGSWVETYNEDVYTVDVDIFSATHTCYYYGSAWYGFIPCVSTSNVDKTNADGGWYSNQMGCMAGGAVKLDANGNVVTDADGKVAVDAGAPYLMAYWSEYMDSAESRANMIVLSSDETLYAKEVYVCTHPYAYYLLINGDSYSRAFDQADDEFVLHIHGLNAEFNDNGKVVDHVLTNTVADGDAYVANQSTDWQRVDLTSLGEVAGLYFTMSSTDSGDWGMNTPAYFCIDHLTVTAENTGVKAIEVAGDATPVYYTLQGVRVNASTLTPGVYVKVVNGKATKVQIR